MSARDDLLDKALAWFAENGVADTSLRSAASALGTSHRMLIYHFGSRDGLLRAVLDRVQSLQEQALARLGETAGDPFDAALAFFSEVADSAPTVAPLVFELGSNAMVGKEYAVPLRDWFAVYIESWVERSASLFEAAGVAPDAAQAFGHLMLSTARGLFFELALTGDREAVDAVFGRLVAMMRNSVDT